MAGKVKLTPAQRAFLQMHLRPSLATARGYLKKSNARKTYVFVRACNNAGIIRIVDPKNYFPYSWERRGSRMVPKLTEFEAKEAARIILGVPRPNADALVAINCAWDMGYRLPATMAAMAKQMFTPPNGRFASTGKGD